MMFPKVSVLIPTLNEESDISGCLEAVARQDYPGEIEVLAIDGCSRDATIAVLTQAGRELGLDVALFTNPSARTSRSLNVGLAAATGEYVVRVDARARIQDHYVRRAVTFMKGHPDVGVVGGAQVAMPRGTSAIDVGIARALRNQWAMGLSRYRRSMRSGPTDTVWMGVFRTLDLRSHGGWSDAVALNEDWELNSRYRATGAIVWFDAGLRSGYLPRPNLRSLAQQYFYFGRIKGTWWARGGEVAPRQLVLLAVPVVSGLGILGIAARKGLTVGLGATLASVAAVDVAGGQGPRASLAAHALAGAGIATIASGWWTGVVVGFLGESIGVRHRHG